MSYSYEENINLWDRLHSTDKCVKADAFEELVDNPGTLNHLFIQMKKVEDEGATESDSEGAVKLGFEATFGFPTSGKLNTSVSGRFKTLITKALTHGDEDVKFFAACGLAYMNDVRCVQVLLWNIQHASEERRFRAFGWLAHNRNYDSLDLKTRQEATETLLASCSEIDNVRGGAITALVYIAPDVLLDSVVKYLTELAKDPRPDIRMKALWGLENLEHARRLKYTFKSVYSASEQAILKLCKDADDEVRTWAVMHIASIRSRHALEVAISALEHPNKHIIDSGLMVLHGFYKYRPKAIRAINNFNKQSGGNPEKVFPKHIKIYGVNGIRKWLALIPFV